MNSVELNISLIQDKLKYCMIQVSNVEDVHNYLFEKFNIFQESYFLKKSGKPLGVHDELEGSIQVVPRLCGGKGGFGSMLRAIGAQIEKTTNREACRDLSGRRLRDINEEQRLKKWISQQAEREREAEERKKKKLEKLSAEPKIEFNDKNYETERSDLVEKIGDSVEQGMKASTSSKRTCEKDKKPKKKRKLLLDFDEDLSSTDDSSSEEQCERTAKVEIKS